MNTIRGLIYRSRRALEKVTLMETQITELEAIFGLDPFKTVRADLEKVKVSENEYQKDFENPNGHESADDPEWFLFFRKQRLDRCEKLINEYQKEHDEKNPMQKILNDVARLEKALDEKNVDVKKLQRLLKDSDVEKAQMKEVYQKELQKSNDEVSRLQKDLDEKDAKNLNLERRLKDSELQMKTDLQKANDEVSRLQTILEDNSQLKDYIQQDLQKSKEDVAGLQKALDEKNDENLNLQCLLMDSKNEIIKLKEVRLQNSMKEVSRLLMDKKTAQTKDVHLKDLQKSDSKVSRLHRAPEDRNMDIENLQRLLKNSEYTEMEDSDIREFCDELGKVYTERNWLKAEQLIEMGLETEQPVGSKTEQPIQVTFESEQPIQNTLRSLRNPEQFGLKNFLSTEQPIQVTFKPEQPGQNSLNVFQSVPRSSHKPEQFGLKNFLRTEQPEHPIPRSLPKTDHSTGKDFQIRNLILINRQLSAGFTQLQSTYHASTQKHQNEIFSLNYDLNKLTEESDQEIEELKRKTNEMEDKMIGMQGKLATVTLERNSLKLENKELKTKYEMVNL